MTLTIKTSRRGTATRGTSRRLRGGLAAAVAVLTVTAGVVATQLPGSAANAALAAAPAAAVTDRAGGISSLSLADAGSSALKLTWSAAPGATNYQLTWRDEDSSASWTSEKDYKASDSPVTLTGLTAGHTYEVSVRPFGADGKEGVPNYALTVARTVSGAPRVGTGPGPISSIKLSAAGPTELKVAWSAAPGARRYGISWGYADNSAGEYYYPGWSSKADYRASDSPVTLTGLLPGRNFVVGVGAYDASGAAGHGNAIAVRRTAVDRTVTPPGTTQLAVTRVESHAFKVAWTPAPGATKYRIFYKDPGMKSYFRGRIGDYSAADSPVVLTGRDNGMPVDVIVLAYNDGGTAPAVSATVPEEKLS